MIRHVEEWKVVEKLPYCCMIVIGEDARGVRRKVSGERLHVGRTPIP